MSTDKRIDGHLRTFGYFYALDGLVVHGGGALLDELVAFDAKIKNFSALSALCDERLHDTVDNLCRSLRRDFRWIFFLSIAVRTLYLVRSASAVDGAALLASAAGAAAGAACLSSSDIVLDVVREIKRKREKSVGWETKTKPLPFWALNAHHHQHATRPKYT